MKHKIAKLISFVFHPIFIALLIPFLFVFKETANFLYGLKWFFFSGAFLTLSLVGLYVVRSKSFFNDIDISIKQERHIFYSIALLTAVLYFIASLVFKGILFPLSIVSIGIILGIVLFDLTNYYMKVSIHMAVVTAYTVSIAMLFGIVPFFAFVWMLPLMGWSRLHMQKHTDKELLAGMFLGAGVTFITFFLGKLLII